jgi:hypothetical protein
VLVSYIMYKKRDQSRLVYIGFTFTSSLLILIRHEGALFLIPFVIETLREKPKSFYKELFLYFLVGVFLVYHVWHFAYFGELLTNPMIAKRQPPYVPDLSSSVWWVIYYLFPFFRAIAVYPILFALLGFNLIFFLRGQGRQKKPKDSLMLGIALTGMFIMLITGMSWNADADRLSYPALAFLLLAIVQYLDEFPIKDVMQKSRIVFTVIFGAVLIVNMAATFRTFTADQRFHITVSQVEKGARFETLVQEYLGLSRMTLASPDMGGLLLFYGDGKRIIDLGLLCNRELAQKGYQLVDSYVLTTEKPELIEIHDVWVIPFSDSELFYENYTPAQIVEGNERWFVFLRNDLIHKLEGQANASKVKIEDGVGLRAEIAFLLEKYDYFWKITFAN